MQKYIKLLGFIIIFFVSCKNNKFDVDISNIKAKIKIERFDSDFLLFAKNKITAEQMQNKYPYFFDIYNKYILQIGTDKDSSYKKNLYKLLSLPEIKEGLRLTKNKFNNIKELEGKIADGIKHYKYYFPNKKLPRVFTFFSVFNQSIVVVQDGYGIGLDKYLDDDKFYNSLSFPEYLIRNMTTNKITSDLFVAIALSEFENKKKDCKLLDEMIYKGRAFYFAQAMLPEEADTLIFGFKQKQLDWCKKNEEYMWKYLIENKLLFSTDYKVIKQFTDIAPFTNVFSKESPSQTGSYLGYKIVKEYMDKNPNITLKTLMNENNFQKILDKSKYKP